MICQAKAVGVALLCLALTSYCKDSHGPHEPTPGWLPVQLSTGAGDVEIARLAITGGRVDSLAKGTAMDTIFSGPLHGTGVSFIVVGSLSGAVVAKAWVPDVSVSYSAVVEEAASSTDTLIPPGVFTVTVVPVR